MLKVAFLHFADDATEQRSGWYVIDEDGAFVVGTPCFDHQASAVRAANRLVNAPVFA